MPNLVRLSAPLTDVTFSSVVTAWKSTLKEIHVRREGIIGDEITGLGVFRADDGECVHSRPPNIADLKVLKKFTQDKGSGYFTDVAVLYGFSFLPKLKTLSIFVTRDLSPDVLAILRKNHVDISWTAYVD